MNFTETEIKPSKTFSEPKTRLQVVTHSNLDFFHESKEASSTDAFGKNFKGLNGLSNSIFLFEPKQETAIEYDLNLSLEELNSGCVKKIKVLRKVLNEDNKTTDQVEKILTINVLPGWRAGTKIVFCKEGDQGPNKIPGISPVICS